MTSYARRILLCFLLVSTATAGPQPESKSAKSLLDAAFTEILESQKLTVAEREPLLKKLLADAEAKGSTEFDTRCKIASSLGDKPALRRQVNAWLKNSPNDALAHTRLIDLLTENAEIVKAMPAALNSFAMQSDASPYGSLIDKLLDARDSDGARDPDFENATAVIQAAFNNKALNFRDEWLLADRYARFVHFRSERGDSQRRARIVEALFSIYEAHLQRYVREEKELRMDMLSMALSPYVSPDHDEVFSKRRIAFLASLRKIVSAGKYSDDDRHWWETVLGREQVTLLHRAGQNAEALAIFTPVFAEVQKRFARTIHRTGDFSEISDWLALGIRVVPLAKLPRLCDDTLLVNTPYFEVITKTSNLSLFTRRDNEELTSASLRIARNVTACARANRALCERWIAAGRWKEALAASRTFRAAISVCRETELPLQQNDDLPQHLNAVEADAVFFDVLITEFATPDQRRMLERFELPREEWRPKPMSDAELRDRVVLLCFGLSASGHYSSPSGNIKLGELPTASDDGLSLLLKRYTDAKFTLIGLIDDDLKAVNGFITTETWLPTPPATLLKFLDVVRPPHPFVYAYRSKFTDAMFRGGQTRAMLFDQTGRLRRVYSRYPDDCELNPVGNDLKLLLEVKSK